MLQKKRVKRYELRYKRRGMAVFPSCNRKENAVNEKLAVAGKRVLHIPATASFSDRKSATEFYGSALYLCARDTVDNDEKN